MSSVFFLSFLENDLSKFDKILGLTSFKTRIDFEGLKIFFPFTVAVFLLDAILQLPFIRLYIK